MRKSREKEMETKNNFKKFGNMTLLRQELVSSEVYILAIFTPLQGGGGK